MRVEISGITRRGLKKGVFAAQETKIELEILG